jgi:hypothetical protein
MTQLAYSPKRRNYKGRSQKSWTLQGNTPSLCHLGEGMGFNWIIAHVKRGWTRHLCDGMGFDWFIANLKEGWTRNLGDLMGFDWFIAHVKQSWTWIGPSSILVTIG